jgi:RimJ/RimL family protein N-acetyltransferase
LNDPIITELPLDRAADLARLLKADSPEYRKFFVGFDDDAEHIAAVLAKAQQDRYWGIKAVDGTLLGMVMLRGLDQGYHTPAFGVYVAQSHAGRGIAKQALHFTIDWCRARGYDELMLTVHPDHDVAVQMYEKAGFQFTGAISPRGHRIYRKKLL